MKTTLLRFVLLGAALLLGAPFFAQTFKQVTPEEYAKLKLDKKWEPNVRYQLPAPDPSKLGVAKGGHAKGGGTSASCGLWTEPDGCPLSQGPNDDESSPEIQIPFTFNLYGQFYTSFWINNNGNISFDAEVGTFTPDAFPSDEFVMIAPFFGDVDTQGGDGEVLYCVSDHYAQMTWLNVGYFNDHGDKLNSFQLTISDGTASIIGVGNNVSFSYQNMEWTTGDASGGDDGFGGSPATVGANLGNGVDFIQIGRFDHPGTDYNGPFGISGVGWLSYKDFVFSTEVSSANIAPILSGNFVCDTINVCSGELVNVHIDILSPETDQIVTASYSAPDLAAFQPMVTNGTTATISGQFQATDADVGYHTITFTGTDNGSPNLTQQSTVVVNIVPSPADPPVLSGSTISCNGTGAVLTVTGNFDHFTWSNGFNGTTALVEPGTYYVTGQAGLCALASNPITVTEGEAPAPVITGVLFNCNGEPAELSTTMPFDNYLWSNGGTEPTVLVGSGTYTVQVTGPNGCTGTSSPVTVNAASAPSASFNASPSNEIFVGTTVSYTGSTSGMWAIDSLGTSGTGSSFTQLFEEPGAYVVTFTTTSPDGCVDTYSYVQVVMPLDILVPNVFTPNGDNQNDALTFAGAEFYPNTELKVFNRYGKMLFESSNYKNTWRAPDVPAGTYYYVLKLLTGRELSGHVTLLR